MPLPGIPTTDGGAAAYQPRVSVDVIDGEVHVLYDGVLVHSKPFDAPSLWRDGGDKQMVRDKQMLIDAYG